MMREQFRVFINNEMEIPGAAVLRVIKGKTPMEIRRKRGEQFITDMIAQCVSNLPRDFIQNAILYYDGEKEQKSFKKALRMSLSNELQDGIYLRDLKAASANRNDGLQVADMLAGFIRNDPASIRSSMVKIIQYPD